MNKNIKIEDYVSTDLLKQYINKLYPINRSILGKGFRDSLKIIGELVDLNIKSVKSGTKVLDWIVPDEWNINDGYIITPTGKKIASLKKHNLNVVNYSTPINKTVNLSELKKHLHTLPALPNAIPYVTSYYKRTWGFCLPHKEFKKLKKGNYKVFINSSIKPGKLLYSDYLIRGKSKKEILISTYLCHSQMANHELSGPLVWSILYKILKATGPHNFSYRFLICPENIGSAAFLHYSKKKVKNIFAGYIINCVGNGKIYSYKKSRIGNSISDQAVENVILNSNKKYKFFDFNSDGSDERQFCSPGFNLPIGLLMRNMFGKFKEYHTSLDDKNFISYKTMIESIKTYLEVLLTIESNFTPIGKIQFGTPQLSRSKYNLYPEIMDFRVKSKSEKTSLMLEILNLSDGKLNLLEIANQKKFKLIDCQDLIETLIKSKYLRKKK